jgi:AAA+ ATPase superfamily predicted ATPase
MIIIKRNEAEIINSIDKWILVYGRRKTGKTFLIKNFVKHDKYFFVKRGKTIINEYEQSYDSFKELLKEYLRNNKTIVIDEFHRLGDDFLDYLHSLSPHGKVILVSSTLYLSKKMFSSKSPLLGLVAEVPVRLIPLDLCIKEISKLGFGKKETVEISIFCREPITIQYIKKGKSSQQIMKEIFFTTLNTVPALLGEIFFEEEKNLSQVYEGIIRSISIGRNKSGEIANYLFSKKLITKENSSMIQQYLKNLLDFGIIKKILIANKNEYFYEIVSPLMKLYFYADEKYNFSEEPNMEKAKIILQELLPKLVESNIREMIASKQGLREAIFCEKDKEIDIFLLKFKTPFVIGEINWGKPCLKEINQSIEKLGQYKDSFVIVPDKKKFDKNPRIKDVFDFI